MFIDELELPESYLKYKKLEKKQDIALKRINQKVIIRDLVVRAQGYGESEIQKYSSIPQTKRLIDHISFLFSLVNEDHRTNNCEKKAEDFVLKEGKQNNITRLSTNEFSLYTQKPLTEKEFQELMSIIEQMAKSLEPNVHVLLSSFAVQDNNGSILNLSVFVEGGKSPKLHCFAKNTASSVDKNYKNPKQVFSQQQEGTNPSHHANFIGDENGLLVNTGSVFEVTTAGGAVYTQAIDVCLDHALGHSMDLLSRKIRGDASPCEIIPEQIEQCVTSNWIDIESKNSIASNVLHVDRVRSMHKFHCAPLGKRCISKEKLEQIKPSNYKNMQIKESKTGYKIINPPFGSKYEVEVLLERPAAKYRSQLQSAVQEHNKQVFDRVQRNSWTQNHPYQLFYHAMKSNHILSRFEELEGSLLNKCRPTFWQWLFITQEYSQKLEAKRIIEQTFSLIKPQLRNDGAEKLFFIDPWIKNLEFRLKRLGINDSFIKVLNQEIKEIIEIKLKNDLQKNFNEEIDSKMGSNSSMPFLD